MLQDFLLSSSREEWRYPGSAGDTALVKSGDGTSALLLRSGFWGAYKCLFYGGSTMGGVSLLGAPTDEEFPFRTKTEGEIWENLDMTMNRQNFQKGYMWWSEGDAERIHVHLNPPNEAYLSSTDGASSLERTNQCLAGAYAVVQSNPPGPRGCSQECEPGDTQCSSPSTIRICGDIDGDGCRDWLDMSCASGLQCEDGSCVDTSQIPGNPGTGTGGVGTGGVATGGTGTGDVATGGTGTGGMATGGTGGVATGGTGTGGMATGGAGTGGMATGGTDTGGMATGGETNSSGGSAPSSETLVCWSPGADGALRSGDVLYLEQAGVFSMWGYSSPAALAVGGETQLCRSVPLSASIRLKVQASFNGRANWAAELGWTGQPEDECFTTAFRGVLTVDSIDVTDQVVAEPWGGPNNSHDLCSGGADGFVWIAVD